MADTQNPVYTDNLTVLGDGTVDHPLNAAAQITPAQLAAIPLVATFTLTAAQLKALATSVLAIAAVPGKIIHIVSAFAHYIPGPGPTAFGNATGNSINLQYAAAPGANNPATQFFGFETDNASTFNVSAQGSIDLTLTTGSFGFGCPANNQASGNIMPDTAIGEGVFIVATNGNFTLGDGSVKVTLRYFVLMP